MDKREVALGSLSSLQGPTVATYPFAGYRVHMKQLKALPVLRKCIHPWEVILGEIVVVPFSAPINLEFALKDMENHFGERMKGSIIYKDYLLVLVSG